MKRKITLLLGLLLVCKCYGQLPVKMPNEQLVQLIDSMQEKKVSYTFSSGVAMLSGNGKGSAFYFAPEIAYRVSSKFKINAGLMVNQNNYSLPVAYIGADNQSVVVKSTPVANQNIFFASGNYTLSPKLLITGSVMTTLSAGNANNSSANVLQNSFQIMSMGLSYKVSENITLSAGMRLMRSNGQNIFQNSYNSLNSFGIGQNPLGY